MHCNWRSPHKSNFWEVRRQLLNITPRNPRRLLRCSYIRLPCDGYRSSPSETSADAQTAKISAEVKWGCGMAVFGALNFQNLKPESGWKSLSLRNLRDLSAESGLRETPFGPWRPFTYHQSISPISMATTSISNREIWWEIKHTEWSYNCGGDLPRASSPNTDFQSGCSEFGDKGSFLEHWLREIHGVAIHASISILAWPRTSDDERKETFGVFAQVNASQTDIHVFWRLFLFIQKSQTLTFLLLCLVLWNETSIIRTDCCLPQT